MQIKQCLGSTDVLARMKNPLQSLVANGAVGIPLIDDGGHFFKSLGYVSVGFGDILSGQKVYMANPIRRGEGLILIAKDAETMIRGLNALHKLDVPTLGVDRHCQMSMFAGSWNDGKSTGWLRGALSMVGGNAWTATKLVVGGAALKVRSMILDALSDKDTVESPAREQEGRRRAWKRAFTHWEDVIETCNRDGLLPHKCAVVFICASPDMPRNLRQGSFGNVRTEMSTYARPAQLAAIAQDLFSGRKVRF